MDCVKLSNLDIYLAVAFSSQPKQTLLKALMGKLLNQDPNTIQITRGPYGKPHYPGLYFNTSDSKDLMVFAFSFQHEIGIDIEYHDPSFDFQEILEDALTENELEQFSLLKDQRKAFFDLWVAKEAYLKQTGTGLHASLKSVQFDIQPGGGLHLKNDRLKYMPISIQKDYSCGIVLPFSCI